MGLSRVKVIVGRGTHVERGKRRMNWKRRKGNKRKTIGEARRQGLNEDNWNNLTEETQQGENERDFE